MKPRKYCDGARDTAPDNSLRRRITAGIQREREGGLDECLFGRS